MKTFTHALKHVFSYTLNIHTLPSSGTKGLNFGLSPIYVMSLCVRAAGALMSLCISAVSTEPSLVAYAIAIAPKSHKIAQKFIW